MSMEGCGCFKRICDDMSCREDELIENQSVRMADEKELIENQSVRMVDE